MADLYTVSLLDILPDNLKADPQVQALAEAITPELQAIARAIDECLFLPRLDELPEDVVDLLAWQYHVDFYDTSLSLEQKRRLVKESFQWHKRKGTPWAVEQVVSIVFPGAKVAEWFDYGGDPYHFRVETEQPLTESTDIDRLIRLINATKNLRSWLDNITIKRTITNGLYFGAVISETNTTTINPMVQFDQPNVAMSNFFGGVVRQLNTTQIRQEV